MSTQQARRYRWWPAFGVAALACASAFVSATASAQDFPSRPIRVIVPTAAGGGFDILARYTAQRISETHKISVVVENRPGAGTLAGTEFVAKAAPDGYTLMLGGVSNLALNPALFRKLPYDAEKDFVPVGFLATYPTVWVVPAELPVSTFKEFVDHVRANPGKLSYASAGVGTGQHVWAAIVVKLLNLDIPVVHYKGAAPAQQDVIAGRVHAFLDNLSAIRPHIQSGKLKALAVSTRERAKQLPNVPSFIETGVVDFEAGSWMALFAPSGTPKPVVDRLRALVDPIVRSPEFTERIENAGGAVLAVPSERQSQFLADEITRWGKLIRQSGIQLD
jgi:tripartite-type tricarboxylate transporter receptor subunit TctC